MYTKNNIIYADPGHILMCGNTAVFQLKAPDAPLPSSGGSRENPPAAEIREKLCPVRAVRVAYGTASWSGITITLPHPLTYAALKEKLIKLRYSNDDQIAILCNGNEEDTARMQAWRTWAATAAHAICAKAGVE